jgi:hypothetical protein
VRLWTLHPKYLDPQGLVALWREGLLAQKVLAGRTRGYRNHPQLDRFRASRDPVATIASYLAAVHREASRRGYSFDASKLQPVTRRARLAATEGQLLFEWDHLRRKLGSRAPAVYARLRDIASPEPHPLFRIRPGPVADWERGAGG